MVEQKYWKQFIETGKIEDYLYYRGVQICEQIMDSHKEEKTHESDNGDRHGSAGDAGWRL